MYLVDYTSKDGNALIFQNPCHGVHPSWQQIDGLACGRSTNSRGSRRSVCGRRCDVIYCNISSGAIVRPSRIMTQGHPYPPAHSSGLIILVVNFRNHDSGSPAIQRAVPPADVIIHIPYFPPVTRIDALLSEPLEVQESGLAWLYSAIPRAPQHRLLRVVYSG